MTPGKVPVLLPRELLLEGARASPRRKTRSDRKHFCVRNVLEEGYTHPDSPYRAPIFMAFT